MSKLTEFLEGATIVDTETTGVDFKTDEIVEVASGRYYDGQWVINEILLGTNNPIPPGASAVHHISNKMIKGLPTFGHSIDKINDVIFLDETKDMVAHNSNFDWRMLSAGYNRVTRNDFKNFDVKEEWVCTWKLAQQILGHRYNEIKYNLGYLRYLLDLDVDDNISSHRAAADVTTCGRLLEFLLNVAIEYDLIDENIDISPQLKNMCWVKPIDIQVWPLGKHKGKKIADVPTDYLLWCIDNIDLLNSNHTKHDKDLSTTVEKVLEARL